MKFINQSYEILKQEIPVIKLDDYNHSHFREQYMSNMFRHIERCGRTCYKSLDRITDDSAEKFVQGLIKSKHTSVLEHGAIYLKLPVNTYEYLKINPYTYYFTGKDHAYVSTNYRVIVENSLEELLDYLCPPTVFHAKRHTVLLHTCIHVYKDLTRHRKMSFSIESTRYCNYSKDKFGNEITFVKPNWITDNNVASVAWQDAMKEAETSYFLLLNEGWQPQQAAEVLPQCTAADVIMSGFEGDWDYVFHLRSDIAATGKPHPLVEELMTPLRNELLMYDK